MLQRESVEATAVWLE